MINGVITQKLQALEKSLAELKSIGKVTTAQLNGDWRTFRAIERDLQVLVEVVIDVCQRLIALAGLTPATTGRLAVERCVELGVLADADTYGQMVQFRNFIVHHYERVDVAILVNMVNNQLGDFERFREEVLRYANR